MRLLLLAPALLLPAASAAAPGTQSPLPQAESRPTGDMPVVDPAGGSRTDCPPISRYHARREGGPLTARILGELPDADMYLAVDRRIEGCIAPVIATYGVASRR